MFVTLTDVPLERLLEVAPRLQAEGIINRAQHEMLVAVAAGEIPPSAFPKFEHLGPKHWYVALLNTCPRHDLAQTTRAALQKGWTPTEVGHVLKQRIDANDGLNKKLRWQLFQVSQGKLTPEQLG
ncbi:MAG TPA: hypothetical protein VJ553_02925 [Candidatus Paceibacterota bacterium]|nr:hypothetical protein [Candidatus Paceibacterota bacterium]